MGGGLRTEATRRAFLVRGRWWSWPAPSRRFRAAASPRRGGPPRAPPPRWSCRRRWGCCTRAFRSGSTGPVVGPAKGGRVLATESCSAGCAQGVSSAGSRHLLRRRLLRRCQRGGTGV